jgi:phage-related protein
MAANPVVLVALAIVGLVAGFVLLYQHVSWFHDLVQTVWHWIADHWPLLLAILLGPIGIAIDLIVKNFGLLRDTVMWVWDNVLKPIFDAIVWYWTLVANAVKWGWENVIKPVWDALSAAVSWLWNNILKPAFDGMKTEWSDIGNVFKWVWDNVLKPVFDAFSNAASWLWNNVLKPGIDATKQEWNDFGNAIKWVWDTIIKPVFDAITTAIDDVKGALNTVGAAASHIPGGGLLTSALSHLQHGGIVTRPTLALVGEAGPEAVIPLNRMRATAAGGPVVNIEHAEFSQQMDVDLFMQRVAWHAQTAVV